MIDSRRPPRAILSSLLMLGLLAATFAGSMSQPLQAAPAAGIPAQATPNPASVTVARSLQDEVGCSGDWQPGCVDIQLAYDAIDDVWQAALNLPAGDWRELATPPVRHPFQNEIMYFVMPDRFANGDTSNDTGGISGDRLDHGFDPTESGFFHGGDLAGLESKLDYLKGLGVTSLWLTPVFKNNPVQGSGDDISAGYHGYWITDFTQFDPHFGSNAELEGLIAAAGDEDIDIYFDIITNHTADIFAYQEDEYGYRSKSDYPYRDADGNDFDDRNYANDPAFPQLDAETSFPYTPVLENPGDGSVRVPSWLNNPIYYHNRGNSEFTGENSLYGDFYGLDDLFTEHPDVVQGMIDIYAAWMRDYDIAGFRIDTMKHVNIEFWQPFAAALAAQAEAAGKDDFFFFGEVFSGNEALLSFYTTQTETPAVLDFKYQEHIRNYVSQGGSAQMLQALFRDDDKFIDANSNAGLLPLFTGNHDRGRFGHFLKADSGASMSDAEMLARSALAHAMLYFARGVPVIYYGDEQGFTGTGGDKPARQDMFPSQVAEYSDPILNDMIGTDATPADDNFDTTHPLYQAFGEFGAIYQAHPTLRTGAQIHRYAEDGPGIYAFSRYDRDERLEYVVAFNNANSSQQASFPVYAPNAQFELVYGNGVATSLTTDGDGQLALAVPATDFVIYRSQASSIFAADAQAPGITITQPADGAQVALGEQMIDGNAVPDRIEVVAQLDRANIYAEVTFAVRTAGSGAWTVIGTDDNPPYRVFYDASDLPAGTQLDFAAVVDVLSGSVNGATVTGITPVAAGAGGVSYDYAVIHYLRSDGDYGDHTSGDFNDFWGLHLWGDAIDPGEVTEWSSPKPFLGETDYGRFAWIRLQDSSSDVNFIVHQGDAKDGTDADRSFNPNRDGPEIWLKQDDGQFYKSQAAAQGYVTIHYQRPDGVYDGWGLHLWGDGIDPNEGTEWTSPKPYDGIDDFGAFWTVLIQNPNAPVNFIIHKGDDKDPGPDQSMIPSEGAHAYIVSTDETIYRQQGDAESFVLIHYRRAAGDYGDYKSNDFNDFWGLHTWGAADDPGWTTPRLPVSENLFGVTFRVPLSEKTELGYIIHRGDVKDPDADMFLDFSKWGYEVWQLQGAEPERPYVLPMLTSEQGAGGNLNEYKAHWVAKDTIAWDIDYPGGDTVQLHYAPAGGMELISGSIATGDALTLAHDPAGLPDAVKEKFPHLANYAAFKLEASDLTEVPAILTGQLAISVKSGAGVITDATGLQIPGVLDDLFTYDGSLGVTWTDGVPTIRLWAPTAKSVKFHLFNTSTSDPAAQIIDMIAGEQGTWSIAGDASWRNKFYLFEVEVYVHNTGEVERNIVTDPYSLSLSTNSMRSQLVDLNDPLLAPAGWGELSKPPLAAPEDIVVYEIHVRDFSVNDPSVPDVVKGTFAAFALDDTNGVQHLEALRDAGLTHVHLLPSFDIATINEDKRTWQTPDIPDGAAPDSEAQRDAVRAVADLDAFNWGYDPYHYTVPEGSYSTDPNGVQRIIEFREMVQALNQKGLRVVMDVVYNHTNASGQAEKSVLDKVVPGYYHRLNAEGKVETSTCCQNTATEHNMMEKLMVDSLVTWAKAYRVDAFRFDLMGHHMKSNMLNVQQALSEVDPSIYIYGEGWNFGEVANNQRGENASQANMAGTGIGTFSDRLRDAVRGGGPFDEGPAIVTNQGFISGLYYDPNAGNSGSQAELDELLLSADQLRVGLAGNLADFEFENAAGNLVKGSEIDYSGAPTGYTQDPQEHLVYVSKHDNETLWDINQFKLPSATAMADRVRVQNLGIDFTVLSQGVPFLHAGVDLLRSKSLDRDSFNSGDWFNKLDFTYQDNNWGVGLPPLSNAEESTLGALLGNPALKPAPAHIRSAAVHLVDMLTIRTSTPLFRLASAADVMGRLNFHNTGPNQAPGLIVMSISDMADGLPDLDPAHELVVTLFNVNDEPQQFVAPALIGTDLVLHPVQAGSGDPAVQAAVAVEELAFDPATATFTVPPRMTAVFVLEQEPPAIDDTSSDYVPTDVPANVTRQILLPCDEK